MISEFDKGWILGFIEGEGSFSHDLQGGRNRRGGVLFIPRFCVNQTNKTPLEFLMRFFGGGHIYVRDYQGKKYWGVKKSTRYDYVVRDIATLERVRRFCDGKLKHPGKKKQFERWKKFFNNLVGKEGQKEIAREEMNKRWKDLEYREKMSKAFKKRWDKKGRQEKSEAMKKLWADPEYRERMLKVIFKKKD